MSETTILRSSAIVRNASVGTTKPPQVNSGALPLVQVKMTPAGPQVQEGQQKPVTILPGKDPKGAVAAGGLPMVQVKMTQNGPQLDDGQDRPVVIRDGKQQTVAAGALPMVQVRMENGGPRVQNMPNVQAGPPQIPGAAPALSHQRGSVPPQTSQGLPRAPHVQSVAPQMQSTSVSLGHPRVARIPAPSSLPPLPEVPELTTDQLMLCRHLVDKYLAELHRGIDAAAAESTDGTTPVESAVVDNAKLAEATIAVIDQAMVSIAVRAEALANAAAASVAAAPVANAYVAPRPVTGGHPAPAAIVPQARAGYVAPRPGSTRPFAGARVHGNSALAPRGVQRGSLPPVIVKMNGGQPVVQQQPVEALVPAPSEQVVSEMPQQPQAADAANVSSDAQG